MNQINKIFDNCKISVKQILILFIFIQPFFDLKIFYNSISTLIRVIFIALFFLYYFLKSKNNKKYFLFIYPVLVIIYFILHHFNALSFNSLVPGNFNYSLMQELLYFVKMMCPFMLIYSLYKAELNKNEIKFIISAIVLFISTIIIFSNIFLFSYGSYSDIKIKANFIEWFNSNSDYVYQDLASKGLFEYANQISAILLMFLPFTIFFNLKKDSKIDIVILLFNIFALVLLCTKVAVLGIGLVFLYTILLYFIVYRKKRNISAIAVLLLFYVLLLPFNPSFSRILERGKILEAASNAIVTVSDNDLNTVIDENEVSSSPIISVDPTESTDFKTNYIINNYQEQKINENFILNRYPYIYDTDFWYDILTNDNANKSDYRYLEKAMVKRVVEINNNRYDKFFGITYTRVQNIFNIEKDFIMQYYSLGILGLFLLIGPYFILISYPLIKLALNKFKRINPYNILSMATICMLFGISYYSGNLLNSLSFTIYFSILFFIAIKNIDAEG